MEEAAEVAESVTVLPGTTDNFYYYATSIHYVWTGELHLAAATDIWVQAAASHDASPQAKFQQHGTANVFYG